MKIDLVTLPALKTAHWQIRANAAQLFFDAYPVEDPELNMEEKADGHEKQLKVMLDLLRDDFPEIRTQAVTQVCKMVAKYWLVLSSNDINKLFNILVKELSCDSSSFRVRVAVVRGMSHIVKHCPRSHVYMKAVLKKFGRRLFDVNDTVRSAFLDLLATVKGVKLINFWDVVGVDEILAQVWPQTKTFSRAFL